MEYPYFIVDNLLDGATSVATNRTAVTNYPVTALYDNLHHTSYKTTAATSPVTITITPSAHRKINCVIIDTKFSDTSGYYQVSVNGSSVVNTQTTQDIVNGTIILTFSEVVALSSSTVTVSLYTALSTFECRHMWVGYYRELPNANYEFDPIQDFQEFRKLDNEDGGIIVNSARFNQKILEATYTNISPTQFGNLDYLRTHSFYTSTPFWFFVRPATDPTVGFMYHWDNSTYARPFQNGNYRGFAIKAKANYTASRSPDRAPFALTKALSLDGSTQYCTIGTPFSIGTTHTIEFWTDSDMPADGTLDIVIATNHGGSLYSYVGFNGTGDLIQYQVQNGAANFTVGVSAGSMVAGTKHHWMVVRNETAVDFFKDNVQLSTTQTLGANSAFTCTTVGSLSTTTHPFDGFLGHLRGYNWALNSTQRARQYNDGAGNDALANGQYFVYEFDDSGGTSTTEDNAEGTATKDLTIVAGATRTAWP